MGISYRDERFYMYAPSLNQREFVFVGCRLSISNKQPLFFLYSRRRGQLEHKHPLSRKLSFITIHAYRPTTVPWVARPAVNRVAWEWRAQDVACFRLMWCVG